MNKITIVFSIFLLCVVSHAQETKKVSDKYRAKGATHAVIELNEDNFEQMVKNGKEEGWLLFFYAPWCRHCKKFAPVFKGMAELIVKNVGGAIDW